jgi:predicted ATP-grasp superfamily ATP-dependent carboligase
MDSSSFLGTPCIISVRSKKTRQVLEVLEKSNVQLLQLKSLASNEIKFVAKPKFQCG